MSLKDMNNFIPVIDLFAGPGGLGEGFSAYCDSSGNQPFKIALSIEKDKWAHQTLELRAFFREFNNQDVPQDYYDYLHQKISRKELFDRHPEQAQKASNQAWCAELGSQQTPNAEIDRKIENAINNHPVWILIGGPPCQAYSIVGRSRRNKDANFEKDKRHFLYKEYLRIVAAHQPPIFVMENVRGILSSKIKGKNIFNEILHDLKNPSAALFRKCRTATVNNRTKYHIYSLVKSAQDDRDLLPEDYIIESERYNIPQKRHRVILLGIRENMHVIPPTLKEATRQYSVKEVIFDLPKIRSGISNRSCVLKEKDSPQAWKSVLNDINDSEWINDNNISHELRENLCQTCEIIKDDLDLGSSFISAYCHPEYRPDWYCDPRLGGICNHRARTHMRSDLHRYFFASCFAKINKKSPKLCDFPEKLLPAHDNVILGVQGDMFSDRFKVQLAQEPSTTITSHLSQDGHYFIHPDPTQCRSFTVREAARLQTFKDNYYFEGPQIAQYQQVGNAVPPLLAQQIAEIVHKTFAIYSSNALSL